MRIFAKLAELDLNLCKKWQSDSLFIDVYEKSLPIVAQDADSDFMSFYLDCLCLPKLKFSKRTIATALRRANERSDDNNMLLMMMPTVLSFCPRDAATTEKRQVSINGPNDYMLYPNH